MNRAFVRTLRIFFFSFLVFVERLPGTFRVRRYLEIRRKRKTPKIPNTVHAAVVY